MRTPFKNAVASLGVIGFVVASRADMPIPTIVHIYFEQHGQPYRHPVGFRVTCYGWRRHPITSKERPKPYTPQPVYSYAGRCSDYGCRIHHSLYLNYLMIDYCDIEGTTAGRSFKIERISQSPVGTCSDPGGPSYACALRVRLPE